MIIGESAENYLETIYMLHRRTGAVRSVDIAAELGYSKPSVCVAMRNLREKGFILTNSDGSITLTDSGKEIAENVLPKLIERAKALREYHRDVWMEIYKPIGWDTMDVKYGAVIARLDTAKTRLSDYVSGKIDSIAELAENRLYYKGHPGRVREVSIIKMMTSGRISK